MEASHADDPIPALAGVRLRLSHHLTFLETRPPFGWVEVHSEDYLSGPAFAVLEEVRADYPVSFHSVALSLGSAHGVDCEHLARIAELARRCLAAGRDEPDAPTDRSVCRMLQ